MSVPESNALRLRVHVSAPIIHLAAYRIGAVISATFSYRKTCSKGSRRREMLPEAQLRGRNRSSGVDKANHRIFLPLCRCARSGSRQAEGNEHPAVSPVLCGDG